MSTLWPRPMMAMLIMGLFCLKVRERANQFIVRLVLRNHGRPRTIGADGCSVITKRERDWVEWSANKTEIFTDSWINPAVTGLTSKRHNAIG